MRFRKGTEQILPFDAWLPIAGGRLSREDWRSLCDRTGIADLDLGTVA